MKSRTFLVNEISFRNYKFLVDTIVDPWGEDDPITGRIRADRFDERASLNFWCFLASRASKGDLFLDVGAFTGLYSLCAVKQNPRIRAIAFEPATATFGRLVRNIALNGAGQHILPANIAVGAARSIVSFPHRFGIHSLCPGEAVATAADVDHTQSVAIFPLDDLRSDNFSSIHYVNSRNGGLVHPPRPVAIKIDVEGHELAVLQGAVGVLDIDRPVIIAEVLTEQALTDLTHFLEAHNYAAEKVTGERNAIFLPAEKVADMTAEYDLWCGKRSRKLPIHGRILTSFAIPL